MKRILMTALSAVLLVPVAHATHSAATDVIAPEFRISHPTVTLADTGSLLTLNVTETKPSFSLNDRAGAQLSLACGVPNVAGTSLLAVTFNGEVRLVGRTKACVDSLARIAANPGVFQLVIKLSTDQIERATPGFEYQIQSLAQ